MTTDVHTAIRSGPQSGGTPENSRPAGWSFRRVQSVFNSVFKMNPLKFSAYLAVIAGCAGLYWTLLNSRLGDVLWVDGRARSELLETALNKSVFGWAFVVCALLALGIAVSVDSGRR